MDVRQLNIGFLRTYLCHRKQLNHAIDSKIWRKAMKKLAILISMLIFTLMLSCNVFAADTGIHHEDRVPPTASGITASTRNASNNVDFKLSSISDGSNGTGIASIAWNVERNGTVVSTWTDYQTTFPQTLNESKYTVTISDSNVYIITALVSDKEGNSQKYRYVYDANFPTTTIGGVNYNYHDVAIVDNSAPTFGEIVITSFSPMGNGIIFGLENISDNGGVGIDSVTWSVSKGATSIVSNVAHNYSTKPDTLISDEYELSNATAGEYSVSVTVKDGLGNTNTTNKIINTSINVSALDITYDPKEFVYDGTEKKPNVKVYHGGNLLTEDVHYQLEFSNNINPGTASIDITGIGFYTGSKPVGDFTIKKRSVIVRVRNKIKQQGDPNPTLEYTIEEKYTEFPAPDIQAQVEGHIVTQWVRGSSTGNIITECTEETPTGTYKITSTDFRIINTQFYNPILEYETNDDPMSNLDRTDFVPGKLFIIGDETTEPLHDDVLLDTQPPTGILNIGTIQQNGSVLIKALQLSDGENGSGIVTNTWNVYKKQNDNYVLVLADKVHSAVDASDPNNFIGSNEDSITVTGVNPAFYKVVISIADAVGNIGTVEEERYIGTDFSKLMAREDDFYNYGMDRAYMLGAIRANKSYYATDVSKVIFTNTIVPPSTAIASWDVSYDLDGSIISWIVDDGNGKYIQYIGAEFGGGDGVIKLTSGKNLLNYYTGLTSIEYNHILPDSSLVEDMSYMFANTPELLTIDMTKYSTSSAINMEGMFDNASKLETINLSSNNTVNVQSMKKMFEGCSNLTNIVVGSGFDTSSVEDMSCMFKDCIKLVNDDVVKSTNFKTTSVIDMSYMFSGCKALITINLQKFNSSNVLNMSNMFSNCSRLTSVSTSELETQNVTDMSGMFKNCTKLSSINLSSFKTQNVTTISSMFEGTGITSIDLSNENIPYFDTTNVTDMSGLFRNCTRLQKGSVKGLEFGSATTIKEMFEGCTNVTDIDLGELNTLTITNMDLLFKDDTSLETVFLGNNVDKINGSNMLYGTNNLKAIITLKDTPITISPLIYRMNNAVLYVKNVDVESAYESIASNITVFENANNIRPVLELIGNSTITQEVTSIPYTDAGATVAKYTVANATKYTQYGLTLDETPNSDVISSTEGVYHKTYTLKRNNTAVTDVTRTINVIARPLPPSGDISASSLASYEYDGKAKCPTVTVRDTSPNAPREILVENEDYTLEYFNNVNVGTATIQVNGINNYYGVRLIDFTITKRNLYLEIGPITSYTKGFGENDPEFNYTYRNNVVANPPDVNVTEIPDFTGAIGRDLGETSGTYRLNQGTLEVQSSNTFNINNYNVVFDDKGATLTIDSITPPNITLSAYDYEYDGTPKCPGVTVVYNGILLEEGTDKDYTVSYRNNINAGTATAVASFRGDYSGESTRDFTINPRPIIIVPDSGQSKIYGEADPTLSWTTVYSTSTEVGIIAGETPNVTGALSRIGGETPGLYDIILGTLELGNTATFLQSNYRIDFRNTVKFEILPKPLPIDITLSPNTFVYDGTEKRPEAIVVDGGVTLVAGTDFYVTYENNVNVGTMDVSPDAMPTAIIHGQRGYTGEERRTFTITPADIIINARIDGNLDVGSTLHVVVEGMIPESARLTYKWFVVNTANTTTGGTQVAGATTDSLVIQESMIGKYIYSVVTASLPTNYKDTEWKGSVGPVRETTPPTTPVLTAKLNNSSGAIYNGGTWTNQNVWLNVYSTDASGIDYYEYSTVGENAGYMRMPALNADGSSTLTVDSNKNKVRYYFRSVDNSGNKSEVVSIVVAIDKDPPIVSDVVLTPNTWVNGNVTAIGSGRDDLSGIVGFLFGPNTNGTYTEIRNTVNTTQQIVYDHNVRNYVFAVKDAAGNIGSKQFSVASIDENPPILTVNEQVSTRDDVVILDIKAKDPDIDLNGDGIADGNGAGITAISVNNHTITNIVTPSVEETALHSVYDEGQYVVKAIDAAGNEATETRNVYAINYTSGIGSGSVSKQVKYEGTSLTIKENGFNTSNYTFKNWNTKPDGTGTSYNPGDTYSGRATITLYAQWDEILPLIDRVILNKYEFPYTGKAVIPQEYVYNNNNIQITRDLDYTVSYLNNIDAGIGTVVVTGMNKYAGQEKRVNFEILKQDPSMTNKELKAELEDTLFVYDGYAKTPKETVYYGNELIRRGPDYTVEYLNNINAGTATVVIKPEPHIDAKETRLTFTIAKADRKLYTYDVNIQKGQTLTLNYTFNGDNQNVSLTSSDNTIATASVNNGVYKVTGVKVGVALLRFEIAESQNYNAASAVSQVTVEENGNVPTTSPGPSVPLNIKPEGRIIINNGAEFTVTPRTVLYISAQNANYMYISESVAKPDVNDSGWQDYSMRLPYVFDSVPGIKTIYAYFKDSQGRISDVAYDTIRLVDRTSTDIELNGNGYDEVAHDSILLDKTQIDKTPPTVDYTAFRNDGLDIEISFKQQDTLVNGTRSGVDNATIKYGYLNLDDGSINYTWQTTNKINNLKYATNYEIVTQAYDKAGNGPTISNAYRFTTTDRFGTVITLNNTDAQYDGATHEIKKATFDLIDNKEITGTITYTYYIDPNCTVETTPLNSGSLNVGSAPSKPGTYFVKVRLRDDTHYFDADSNVGQLRIGWYIGKEEKNIFSYIEEKETGTGEYILHVIGSEEMKDLNDIKAQDPEIKYTYWDEYKHVITALDLGTHSTDDIRNIGAEVFSGLTSIREIIIPDTITRIGDSAFDGDRSVTNKVVIPSGVVEIGINPFAGVNTKEFEVRYGNDFYDTIEGILTNNSFDTIIAYPSGRLETKYNVPDGIISIAENAFKESDILEHVIIPDGVQHIEARAFLDCDRLQYIEVEDDIMPDDNGRTDLISVGNEAFYNIKQGSIIYTFSKKVANLFESGTDYDPLRTEVYYPPTIIKDPKSANGVEGKPLTFKVEAEPGYPEPLFYQWFRKGNGEIGEGSPATGSGDKTSTYTTNNLSRSNNNKDRYYARVYNDNYYFTKIHPKTGTVVGYINSKEAIVTMISQPNYAVETSDSIYYFERLDAAFNMCGESGDLVRVINNVTGENNARLGKNKNVKMTFDGHTIATEGTITIESNSSIEFVGAGGIEKSGGGYVFDNNGTIKMNGTFTISNISGSAIKNNKGSYLTLDSCTLNVKTDAILAQDSHVNITSSNVEINAISDGSTHGITLNGETRFIMDDGRINVRCTSTSSTTSEVVGIYVDGNVNGRNEINSGIIKVSCGTDGTPNTNIGSGIVNAGASDVLIRGGKIDASKAKAGIETIPTNKYGDIFIRSGEVTGGKYGVLNNADAAKVAIGVKDGNVTDASPVITGEVVSIFNTNSKTTFEFYDGTLLSGTELVIYQSASNPSLTIPANAKYVKTENGHIDVITEEGYSVHISTEGRFTKGTLGRDRSPEVAPLEDKYIKADERATFEIVIINEGHPNIYNYEWQVSNDDGRTWTAVTVGNGANTELFTTPPMAPNMDGYQYRCKITNGSNTLYTNAATIYLVEENQFKEQRPIVRVIYKDGRVIKYDSDDNKYVDMQITIKAYEPLQTIKFTYGKDIIDNLLTSGNVNKTNDNGFSLISRGTSQIVSPKDPNFVEYSYTYDVKAYRNDAITVKAVDRASRDATETQTIDIIYDLKVDKTISKLSDSNSELVITFFANRPVRPYKSDGNETAYAYLTSVENSNFSFRYTYKPESSVPYTKIYFEDEFGNTTTCSIDAITRVQYKDVIFNTTGTRINDLSVVEAYGVAQGLEAETEVNSSLNVQSRYGVNRTQVDMFMGRARDLGAADILMSANSSRAFDGVIPVEQEATQSKDTDYDYKGNTYNNYVSTAAGSSHGLANENSAYVDSIEKTDTRLYKIGKEENLTGFVVNDVQPYMVINNTGQAVNTNNEINEATFRAVIVNN